MPPLRLAALAPPSIPPQRGGGKCVCCAKRGAVFDAPFVGGRGAREASGVCMAAGMKSCRISAKSGVVMYCALLCTLV